MTAALTLLGPSRHVVERNLLSYRRLWVIFVAGFIEPIFYLLGLGVGLGQLVGEVDVDGQAVEYAAFVAPGLIASSAMNGAIFDATFNFYFKLKYAKTFDAMLTTPLGLPDVVSGEIIWSTVRGTIYAAVFLGVAAALGLTTSFWALLTIPAAMLVGVAFSAAGTALSSLFRSFHDFDYLQLAVQPMFLASTTFFPLAVFPDWSHPIVQLTPLYHGVSLCRNLAFGVMTFANIGHIAYLLAMTAIGTMFTRRRLDRLLLS